MAKQKKEIKPEHSKRLNLLCKTLNIKKKELADITGYSPQHITNISSGRVAMSLDFAQKISDAITVPTPGDVIDPRWLTGESEYMTFRRMAESKRAELEYEGQEIDKLFCAFAEFCGYNVSHSRWVYRDDLSFAENEASAKEAFKHCTVLTKGNSRAVLSLDETIFLENTLVESYKVLLDRFFSVKGKKI